jgi:hypothetical protein
VIRHALGRPVPLLFQRIDGAVVLNIRARPGLEKQSDSHIFPPAFTWNSNLIVGSYTTNPSCRWITL